jgi:hypothetical protein
MQACLYIYENLFVKLLFILFSALISSYSVSAQYFYHDLYSSKEAQDLLQKWKKLNVSGIEVVSNDKELPLELKTIWTSDYRQKTTTTLVNKQVKSQQESFYNGPRIQRSNEMSKGIEKKLQYSYQEKGLLKQLQVSFTDTAMKIKSSELHSWYYYPDGLPEKMFLIKNQTDTTNIEFIIEQLPQPKVTEEHWKKKDKTIESFYYYYNDQGLLSDIVRFNNRLQKMLPDRVFNYDANGKLIEMIETLENKTDYYRWMYEYDSNGLKVAEKSFNKAKQLQSLFLYNYQFFKK